MGNATKSGILAIWLALAALSVHAQIIDDFSASQEGWYTWNDGAGGTPYLFYSPTGGNPGGHVYATDTSVGVWYFLGNSDFKNDVSEYNGCYLLYDIKIPTILVGIPTNYSEVILQRTDGNTLQYNTALPTVNVWCTFAIVLHGSGWTWNSPGGTAATDADMLSTLSDLKKLKIRAEFSGLDEETNHLDNVIMACDLTGLPVQISTFEVFDAGNRTAEITWRTESELDCDGFVIEKSTNGMVFDSIGYIPGQGTTESPTDYSFYDNYFVANAYYRLREHKTTGRNFLGDLRFLKSETNTEFFADIYPNPARDAIYLISNSPDPVIAYEICGTNGAIFKRSTIASYSGVWQTRIDVRDLPSGIYIANFYMDGKKESQLFEVTH
ncbi:MAG: laminin B domain-containing protein [Chitinophagales bacterium]